MKIQYRSYSTPILKCNMPNGVIRTYDGVEAGHINDIRKAFKYTPNKLYSLLSGYSYFDMFNGCQNCSVAFINTSSDPLCSKCEGEAIVSSPSRAQ